MFLMILKYLKLLADGLYHNFYLLKQVVGSQLLLVLILALKMQAYYEPSELAKVSQMFPFEYTVDSELIFGNQDFEIGNFGGSPVVVG